MKTNHCLLALLLSPLVALPVHAQAGGAFDLSWSKIAGGGGTSTGGQFTLSGTAGQHDAGTLKGGQFTLEGGFWSGIQIVQMPGAPLLKIKLMGQNAVISWPLAATGFALQETADIASSIWNPTPQPVVDTASEHTVTVPAQGIRMYRLKK